MARPRKESHPITVRLEQNIYDRLNDFCERSGQPKTVAIERAIKTYIESFDGDLLSKLEVHKQS
ncbi:MAG: CopG family transcriptional regulator [Clostridia bacterium]|nr:CopG family transcriptional regulator [Clostridia bacterium]